jgi:cytochrome c oxidase assembly protein subunit 15
VSLHLVASMAMICLAVLLLWRLDSRASGLTGLGWLGLAIFAAGWAVLYAGTVVTGSGPHAGDARAPRNGLDPRALSQLHTDFVMVLLGLTVAAVLVLRALDAPARARRAAAGLLAVEVLQGAVGFLQYFLGVPVGLVILHLLGAGVLAAAMTWLLLVLREPAPDAEAPEARRPAAPASGARPRLSR